jgi:hypothetical protein
MNIGDIKDLVIDLQWDYDRMSTSGQEVYKLLCNVLEIEGYEDL